MTVSELRLALTVPDLDAALALYRDTLGMPEVESFTTGDARGVILSAGRATLELFNEAQAALVDDLEVGRRVAPTVRVALEVPDSATATTAAVSAGAHHLAGPVETPWGHHNARIEAPGLQLTLFSLPPTP